jgi:D-alanyl-lipoteichoic acid acyltransferase DltB (MBOAT superfamily)
VIGAFMLARLYRPAWAPGVLLAASLLFCAAAGPVALAFLLLSILGNFAASGAIRRLPEGSAARRRALAAAIVANLIPLVLFKLAEQGRWTFAGQPAAGAGAVVPLGLAFYTLQQITFLIDAQRPDAVRLGFVRFAAWGSFFGQLPAGPIGAYARMAPQYARLGLARVDAASVARGLTLILAGIIKKTWLADPVARKVDAILLGADLGSITPIEAWTGAWGFLLQLYLDFSAYSDIAIGVGLCFGLILPINFNSPLKARTPGAYVMRWHISMMMFVRDYLFDPLFRAARRLPVRPASRRYALAWAIATLAAFLAVAAWHTLAPIALLEGLGVAAAIVGFQFVRQTSRRARGPGGGPGARILRTIGHLLLLVGASVTALFLRASAGQMMHMLPALFDLSGLTGIAADSWAHFIVAIRGGPQAAPALFPNARLPGLRTAAMMAATTAIVLLCPNTMQIFGIAGAQPPNRLLRWRPTSLWGVIAVVLFALAMMGMTRPVQQYDFVYARF